MYYRQEKGIMKSLAATVKRCCTSWLYSAVFGREKMFAEY